MGRTAKPRLWSGWSIETQVNDVRYGLRLIRKAPAFSAVAIASLAVGIGASSVLFSFANSLLFRPLHAAHPEQLIQIFTSDFDGPRRALSVDPSIALRSE